jgi:prepilin-type N-terminal cleavage/methylation domain-containing protein/prepilin-type processing-associated H-X9-DG protein
MIRIRCSSNPNHGFTLVELLVVIVIIAVLASIGFVSGRRLMDSASKARSMGNLKQLATTGQVFSSENSGVIPHAQHTAIVGTKRIWCQHYAVSLSPDLAFNNQFREEAGDRFGRDAGIFTDEKAFKRGRKSLAKSGPNSWRTFAYNNRIGAASPENPGELAWVRGVRHVGQVEAPDKLVLFTQKTLAGDNYPQFLQPEDARSGTVDFDLHGGTALVGFFDGHVELFQKKNFPAEGGTNPGTGKPYSGKEVNHFWLGREAQLPQL